MSARLPKLCELVLRTVNLEGWVAAAALVRLGKSFSSSLCLLAQASSDAHCSKTGKNKIHVIDGPQCMYIKLVNSEMSQMIIALWNRIFVIGLRSTLVFAFFLNDSLCICWLAAVWKMPLFVNTMVQAIVILSYLIHLRVVATNWLVLFLLKNL